MGEVQKKNLGELFKEAKKGQLTEKQKNKQANYKKSNTGIHYVHTVKCHGCKQGFTWRYAINLNNKKKQTLQSVNLVRLKKRVEAAGLPWKIDNEFLARKTAIKANTTYEELLPL